MKDPTTFAEKMGAFREKGIKEFESILNLADELEKTLDEEHLEQYSDLTKEEKEDIHKLQPRIKELKEQKEELRKKIEQFKATCELYDAVTEKEAPENNK